MINDKPFIVIDLYSGGYTSTRRGHEELNFEWIQSKQKYLGYYPAHNDVIVPFPITWERYLKFSMDTKSNR